MSTPKISTDQPVDQFVQELDSTYPLSKYLREHIPYKTIPRVYRNEEVELLNEPGLPWLIMVNGIVGSGKSSLAAQLEERGLVTRVKTATTRLRRHGEDGFAFKFMRLRKGDESIEQYHENLINEYELIESSTTHGNLYGLPKSSLDEALAAGRTPLIVNEPDAVLELRRKLKGLFNIAVVFVMPDSWSDSFHRIDSSGAVRDNLKQRFVDSVEMLRQSESTAHFYLHNAQFPLDAIYRTGFEEACEYFYQLVSDIVTPGAQASGL
ncbi:MAG: hypothetical protein QY318_00645 [Candidatus Dojkabacteria bacterium]|nr:MAG: hypothetical protein QY318_00645 [Candidatus Dojkabacteria bacterium]